MRASAIKTTSGITWPADPADPKTVGNTLYSGAPGVVLFLPWVPTLLDQAAHTGTPWAEPARPAIGDATLGVHRAEVPARRDVAGPEVEVDPQRLQHAPPHRVVERIVAEEAEVPRPAARRDSGPDVADQAAGGAAGSARR